MEEAKFSGVPVQEGGGTNGEFIVHTKHTCDKCFQQPIIGMRYKSSVHPNFDICARCFDAYSGPEIGLGEAVLARDRKHSRDFVMKLKIDNGGDVQVRRIKVSEVWGKSIAHLSFGKMMTIASRFAFPDGELDDAGLESFIAKAKATYIDEDGDAVNMTSNGELEDAFLQAIRNFPPVHKSFLIKVTIPKDSSKVCAVDAGKPTGMPKRIQVRKIEPSKKAFAVSADPSLAMGKSKTTLRVTPKKFESDFFVHARHTCDGCSKTPIIGTRYHATKIPDFDLCGSCFEKYEGEDLDFKSEIQDRDRRMQQRWLKKQLSHSSKVASNVAGAWSNANGDLADFLKKVQASGATIESATVYACPSVTGEVTAPIIAAENTPDDAAPLIDAEESVQVEAAEAPTTPLKEAEVEAATSIKSPSLKGSNAAQGEPSKEDSLPALAVLVANHRAESPVDTVKFVPRQTVAEMQDEPSVLTHDKSEAPAVGKAPSSPAPSHDESFLSEADGNGSIAEAIGRTLDVCVAAIEDAMADDLLKVDDEPKSQKSSDFSVASSIVTGVTDILKELDEEKAGHQPGSVDNAAASNSAPSVVTSATILKSEDGTEKKTVVEMPKVEDASMSEDEWSVISDEKDKSAAASIAPISPVLLAKWDTELRQLHELGFLDDRKNMDTLEHLEAAHVGVDSTEHVTVNAVVEHLLA